MNKKHRFNQRWVGFITGAIGPLFGLLLVFVFYMVVENFTFNRLWHEFMSTPDQKSRFLSLSVLVNLAIFYLFLRKDFNSSAMGVVLGTMLYIPVILYLKFLA